MSKKITAEAALVRANHLRQLGSHNNKMANKWDRIARKLLKKDN